MPTRKTTSNLGPKNPEESLNELLALPMDERRSAVARDLKRRSPRYRDIPGHALADALGVPDPECPGSEWSFTRYAEIVTVEDYARHNSPASELVYLIEDSVDPKRFQRLLELSEPLDDVDEPSFSFLLKKERDALEHAIAEEQLESNASNGMCCLARYTVQAPSGDDLEFEGDIEDDGACFDLRTPYDKRAKRFRDLTRCLTDDW